VNAALNRKIHAIAGGIAPSSKEAHELVSSTAREQVGKEYRDCSDAELAFLAKYLQAVKDRMRKSIYHALGNGMVEPISDAQIRYVREMRSTLGWSDRYFDVLLRQRYDEGSLETMPMWKAVRLVAMLQRRVKARERRMIYKTIEQHRPQDDGAGRASQNRGSRRS
jgi:hypothetical protein